MRVFCRMTGGFVEDVVSERSRSLRAGLEE